MTAEELTIQIFWSCQVDDSMDHLPSILTELAQVLAQRFIVQPLLWYRTKFESLVKTSCKHDTTEHRCQEISSLNCLLKFQLLR